MDDIREEQLLDGTDFTLEIAERDALECVLRSLSSKESHVLLARVLEEKTFVQISKEIGIGYKGTAAIYYRTIAKLREMLGGGTW